MTLTCLSIVNLHEMPILVQSREKLSQDPRDNTDEFDARLDGRKFAFFSSLNFRNFCNIVIIICRSVNLEYF